MYGDPDVPLAKISQRSSNNLAAFSSRGPTLHDGRFKPDLVAPGEGILSMSSKDSLSPRNANYCTPSTTGNLAALNFISGTSVATPLVAGAMEFIRQYFVQGFYPTGAVVPDNSIAHVPEALLRAVVLAGSRQITGKVNHNGVLQDLPAAYPNYAIGFGMPVVDRALFMQGYTGPFANGLQLTKTPLPSFASGASVAQLYQFRCGSFTADESVHIVLTWTDPAGNPAAIKQIVNDLDLVVVDVTVNGSAGIQLLGNNGDFPDTTNTVEKVALASCSQGQVVKVAINPGRVVSTQAYAVVVNGNVEMGSFQPVAAGAFTFDPKRPDPLPSSNAPHSGTVCSASIQVPIVLERSPLGPSPTSLALTVASLRFSAALAMYMGVGLQAVNTAFIMNSGIYSSINLTFFCSSYICQSSESGLCHITATDTATALRRRIHQLVRKANSTFHCCDILSRSCFLCQIHCAWQIGLLQTFQSTQLLPKLRARGRRLSSAWHAAILRQHLLETLPSLRGVWYTPVCFQLVWNLMPWTCTTVQLALGRLLGSAWRATGWQRHLLGTWPFLLEDTIQIQAR
jgi:hypothetical protein